MTARKAIRVAAALTAFCASAASAAPTGTRGNVNGSVEQPLIESVLNCKSLEDEVVSQLSALPANQVPDSTTLTVTEQEIVSAQDCLRATLVASLTALDDVTTQNTTLIDTAKGALIDAIRHDHLAEIAMSHHSTVRQILDELKRADDFKHRAFRAFQGLRASSGEQDLYGSRRVVASSPQDGYGLSFDGRKDNAFAHGRFRSSDASAAVATDPTGIVTKAAPKTPTDRYVAFRAKKKKAAAGGTIDLGREVRGPFESVVTAGFFNLSSHAALAALGTTNAYSYLRFDVKGASAPEFLSLCAQPGNGTVRVFALNASGEIGSTTVIHANRVVLHVRYDGATFVCEWKYEGAPDGTYAPFAAWTRVQGTDSWTASLGGAELTGAAEAGLDDLAIWATYVF